MSRPIGYNGWQLLDSFLDGKAVLRRRASIFIGQVLTDKHLDFSLADGVIVTILLEVLPAHLLLVNSQLLSCQAPLLIIFHRFLGSLLKIDFNLIINIHHAYNKL